MPVVEEPRDRHDGLPRRRLRAAGGLGGFFPPLVMAIVKSLTGSYVLGFVLFAVVAVACLIVLESVGRTRAKPRKNIGLGRSGPTPTHR